MFEVKRYTPDNAEEWNLFVEESRNGTFLFHRSYMDYHSDRFSDYSLMFYDEKGLFAVMPANMSNQVVYSHQGLTYGGLVVKERATAAAIVEAFQAMNTYLRANNIHRVVYKAIPWIYQQIPSQEDLYALTQVCQARLTVRELSTTIVLPRNLRWSRVRRRGVVRAKEAGVVVEQSSDFASFWPILERNLYDNHHVHPVHTLAEMELLHDRFHQQIILYTASLNGETVGGIVLYLTPQVVHAQYSSATPEGKQLGVLDAIYDRIMHEDMKDYPYFDFGKSTEEDGRILNRQLVFQKEGFAGRGVCYDTYEWTL